MATIRTATGSFCGLLLASGIAATTAGCTWFQTDVNRWQTEKGRWSQDEPRTYTTAEIRIISERTHPQTGQRVVCTEPSPDVAKALSTVSQLSFKGSSNAGASGEAGFAGGSAEAIAELAGRSTALIALRDGLYRACEAYANGAIGSDAYALVLSRYGQLMTTLFLGEDIRGAAAAIGSAPAVASPALITINPASGSQAQTPSTTGSTNSGSTTQGGGNKKTSGTPGNALPYLKVANIASPAPGDSSPPTTSPAPIPPAATPPPSTGGATPPKKNSTTTAPPATQSDSGKDTTDTGTNASTTNAGISAVAAVSLVRMNEDYFDLDTNFMHQLVIACINEYDPTRKRLRDRKSDDSPATLAHNLNMQVDQVTKLQQQQGELVQSQRDLQSQQEKLQLQEKQIADQTAKVAVKNAAPHVSPSPGSEKPHEIIAEVLKQLPDTAAPIQNTVEGENPWLRVVCPSLANVKMLVGAEEALLLTFKEVGHPADDVKPDLGLTGGSSSPGKQSDNTTKMKPNLNPNPSQSSPAGPQKRSPPQSSQPPQAEPKPPVQPQT
jgi:hypothetical protein